MIKLDIYCAVVFVLFLSACGETKSEREVKAEIASVKKEFADSIDATEAKDEELDIVVDELPEIPTESEEVAEEVAEEDDDSIEGRVAGYEDYCHLEFLTYQTINHENNNITLYTKPGDKFLLSLKKFRVYEFVVKNTITALFEIPRANEGVDYRLDCDLYKYNRNMTVLSDFDLYTSQDKAEIAMSMKKGDVIRDARIRSVSSRNGDWMDFTFYEYSFSSGYVYGDTYYFEQADTSLKIADLYKKSSNR